MPKISELVQVFDPLRAKLICDESPVARFAQPGFVMMWFGGTTPTGWLTLNGGSIGNAASGGTSRANADVFYLYENLWNSLADAQAPVSGGRGASAAADFAAGKTLTLPDMRQRFPLGKAASGTGSTIGGTGGSIDHTHSVPAHHHAMGSGADLNITASGSHAHDQKYQTGVGAVTQLGGVGSALVNNGNSGGTLTGGADTLVAATHTHPSGDFAGKIGLVTGGVDGNAAMTSGTANPPFVTVNFIIAY